MPEKINANCSICGKGYHMCLSCKDKVRLNPWMKHTDTSEHYKIYQILSGYSNGVYSKSEAKSKLQNVDLSDLETFREHIKNTIKSILAEDKTIINEKASVDDEIMTTIESLKSSPKSKMINKRKVKRNNR